MKLELLHIALISGILFGLHTVNGELHATTPPTQTLTNEQESIYRRPQLEKFIISFTNQVRAENGLSKLATDQNLIRISRFHSDDMMNRNYTGHISPEGMTPDERVSAKYRTFVGQVSENVWVLTGDWKGAPYNESASPITLASRIVDEWMQSPAHRKNLLTENLSHMGVGVSVKHGKLLVTQLLVNRIAVLQKPLSTFQNPSSHIDVALNKEISFDRYQYCFELLRPEAKKKKYVSFTQTHRIVETPDIEGIYRLIVMVKSEGEGDDYFIYRGPIIIVEDQESTKHKILTSLYPNKK